MMSLTYGLFTQVSESGPHGSLCLLSECKFRLEDINYVK